LSSGYDFNPFEDSRLDEQARRAGIDVADLKNDPFVRAEQSGQLLSEGDLVQELAEIISAANRANATLNTIDPRGLVAGPDVDQPIKTQEWLAFVRDSQDSLRVMADGTGGLAVVNMNDFDAAFRRIDADTSDYYVLGYYSNNADTSRRTRRIEVRTTRRDVRVYNRTSYTLPREK
jgi:VWFA-related protein